MQKEYATGKATEHSYRPALKELIESLIRGVHAQNEPQREKAGAPDFIITKSNIPLGYIEAKDIGVSLDVAEKSEQLVRYLRGLSGRRNLILTDYLEFRWFVNGEIYAGARIGSQKSKSKLKFDEESATDLLALLDGFLTEEVSTVGTSKELAERMAASARIIYNSILSALQHEDKGGSLHEQLQGFREVLIHDLDGGKFADMYAQTICYGLFAARVNHDGKDRFTRKTAAFSIPKTNPFLARMYVYIAGPQLDDRVTWAVDDLAELLERSDMSAILADFGKRTMRVDPVIHFYETFLTAYDPTLRSKRGVYYTPEPVVSFIVRSVDHILKTDFGLKDGLADKSTIPIYKTTKNKKGVEKRVKSGETHKVLVLDPACGTGTFLSQVTQLIYEYEVSAKRRGSWSSYVQHHLLPRLFGFELLMAPYSVAHMKLGMQLAETGYDFKSNERLGIYLTNTLEEAEKIIRHMPLVGWLTDEAREANSVKLEAPVMVLLGNPPYSGHSVNKGEWIHRLLHGEDVMQGVATENYFEVDGKPLGEKNPKWLNDDYVKFIRFAQWRIEQTGYGILAFITNHGYLDNPTFRGMRQSLMNTFDDIYILDLHGNAKKKEKAPDGGIDKNVFDIQQGVAIGIFVKKPSPSETTKVFHADLWGERGAANGESSGKYGWLAENDLTCDWDELSPTTPQYLFVPRNSELAEEYEAGASVSKVFPVNSVGIVTARDSLTIRWTNEEMQRVVRDFVSLEIEEARAKYKLGDDARDWKVTMAQDDVRQTKAHSGGFVGILYRPFDTRFTYYTGNSRGFQCMPRPEVMRHMLAGENLAISTTRSIEIGRGWEHVFCSKEIIQHHTVSLKEVNYLFPLYLYPDSRSGDFFEGHESGKRKPNLSDEFIKEFSDKLKLKFISDGTGDLKSTFGPEDIFHYMYAVFHSPTYRKRYAEFLKSDFPRLPLTDQRKLFSELCAIGAPLVKAHLMEAELKTFTSFNIPGDGIVEKVRYTEPSKESPHGRVWINAAQYFENVPPGVWEFHVGGYQVCQKWLKDRKGRALSSDDVTHYQYIVAALAETIRLMEKIDTVIDKRGGWPIR
ncbi:MAG: DNA methyltransferase [candidate division Zixibacteria bacterium]|nr:DNA methyltransferase [candidate division Zixibacteria bacterium]